MSKRRHRRYKHRDGLRAHAFHAQRTKRPRRLVWLRQRRLELAAAEALAEMSEA